MPSSSRSRRARVGDTSADAASCTLCGSRPSAPFLDLDRVPVNTTRETSSDMAAMGVRSRVVAA